MTPPIPATGNAINPPVVVPPPVPESKPNWPIRLTYQALFAGQNGHGMQVLSSPSVKLGKKTTLTFASELNLRFKFDPSETQSLSRDDLLASGSSAFRQSKYRGVTYTDITDGSAIRQRLHQYQFLQWFNLLYQPFEKAPIEIGVRFALGFEHIAQKMRMIANRTEDNYPTDPKKGKCVPGDKFCKKQPIPTPDLGPSQYVIESEESFFNFFMVGGPRISWAFTKASAKYVGGGMELLFRANTRGNNGLEPFVRSPVYFSLPLSQKIYLTTEIRPIVLFEKPYWALDIFAGARMFF